MKRMNLIFIGVWNLRMTFMEKPQVAFLMAICVNVLVGIQNYFQIRNYHIGQIVPQQQGRK